MSKRWQGIIWTRDFNQSYKSGWFIGNYIFLVYYIDLGKTASLHPDIEDPCFQSRTSVIFTNRSHITNILHDADFNSCLVPAEIASNRLLVLMPLAPERRHIDFRLVGRHLPCVPLSLLGVFSIPTYEGVASKLSVCTLTRSEDCMYRCVCPKGCNAVLLYITEITEASACWELCEIINKVWLKANNTVIRMCRI